MEGDMIVVVVDREMGFRRQLEKYNMPLALALEARDLCFVVFFCCDGGSSGCFL